MDVRVALVKGLEHRRRRIQCRRVDHRYGQDPVPAARELDGRLPRLGRLLQQRDGFRKEQLAERGQLHRPIAAVEQLGIQRGLEAPDPAADLRLGQTQMPRRGAEVQMFGDRHEGLQFLQVHASPSVLEEQHSTKREGGRRSIRNLYIPMRDLDVVFSTTSNSGGCEAVRQQAAPRRPCDFSWEEPFDMSKLSLTRRQSLALGAASLFTLGSKGVNAQGQAELTFWTVRLNTPELQEALLPLLDQFMAENPGIKISTSPSRAISSIRSSSPRCRASDAGHRRGLFLPSAAVRRARPDGADGRHHRRVGSRTAGSPTSSTSSPTRSSTGRTTTGACPTTSTSAGDLLSQGPARGEGHRRRRRTGTSSRPPPSRCTTRRTASPASSFPPATSTSPSTSTWRFMFQAGGCDPDKDGEADLRHRGARTPTSRRSPTSPTSPPSTR